MALTDKAGLAILGRMIKAGKGTQVSQGIIHGAMKEGKKYAIKQGLPGRAEFEVFCDGEIEGDKVFQGLMQQVGLNKKTVVGAMVAGYDEAMKQGEQGDIKRIPKRQPCPKCGKWVKHKDGIYKCNKCHKDFELSRE